MTEEEEARCLCDFGFYVNVEKEVFVILVLRLEQVMV